MRIFGAGLLAKEDNVKVTLELSRNSVNRFKRYAKKKGFKYQRMIRNLVDEYTKKSTSLNHNIIKKIAESNLSNN